MRKVPQWIYVTVSGILTHGLLLCNIVAESFGMRCTSSKSIPKRSQYIGVLYNCYCLVESGLPFSHDD